jgi:hypothetical protein
MVDSRSRGLNCGLQRSRSKSPGGLNHIEAASHLPCGTPGERWSLVDRSDRIPGIDDRTPVHGSLESKEGRNQA